MTFSVVSPPPPSLSTIDPNSGLRGTNVTVTLTGANLNGATAVTVSGNGVAVNSFTVNSATSITAVFALSSTSTGVGSHTVRVVTPGGPSNPVTFTKT